MTSATDVELTDVCAEAFTKKFLYVQDLLAHRETTLSVILSRTLIRLDVLTYKNLIMNKVIKHQIIENAQYLIKWIPWQ